MAIRLADGLTLYFARHGQTQANVEKRFQGWTCDTPLTNLGLEQALDVGRILMQELGDQPSIACVSSPLPRARTTMEIVRSTLHIIPSTYAIDDRLIEINLGSWDGLTEMEARSLDPGFFDARMGDKWDIRVPGGENYADVASRARDWLQSLDRDCFAVSHGAFTRIVRGLFLGLDGAGMSALDEPQGVVFRVRGSDVVQLDPKSNPG